MTKKESRKPARKSAKKKGCSLQLKKRQQMIAEAAYYRAENRGFVAGEALQNWLEAEDEIGQRLGDRP